MNMQAIYANENWQHAENVRRAISAFGIKAERTWTREPGGPKSWQVIVPSNQKRRAIRLIAKATAVAS